MCSMNGDMKEVLQTSRPGGNMQTNSAILDLMQVTKQNEFCGWYTILNADRPIIIYRPINKIFIINKLIKKVTFYMFGKNSVTKVMEDVHMKVCNLMHYQPSHCKPSRNKGIVNRQTVSIWYSQITKTFWSGIDCSIDW